MLFDFIAILLGRLTRTRETIELQWMHVDILMINGFSEVEVLTFCTLYLFLAFVTCHFHWLYFNRPSITIAAYRRHAIFVVNV